jgi:hypothetical protein
MTDFKIDKAGTKTWYNSNGQIHRDGGPAIEFASGDKLWCQNGEIHREDGPAEECYDGRKYWWIAGEIIE